MHYPPPLNHLQQNHKNLSIRRWVAQTKNRLRVYFHPESWQLYQKLLPSVIKMRLETSQRIPQKWFKRLTQEQIGQVLVALSLEQGNLTYHPGFFRARLTKGDCFDLRFWRILHELLNPSPDKRQAHPHTIGRIYRGRLIAQSPIMGELTQTKVPGEPLLQAEEGGWRPYLPLVDQVLYSAGGWLTRPTTRLHSAEGVTTLVAPRWFFKRFWAKCLLTSRFPAYAALRNWRENSTEPAAGYVQALKKLGFQVNFKAQENETEPAVSDPSVQRFFAIMPFGFNPDFLLQIKEYIFSVYENSLHDLALFTALLMLFFFGTRLRSSYKVLKARRRLPMVVGGWGTRGKSGVERLKAALFESLGHPILAKSTGCEAMFMLSHPLGKTKEMFLFRPYDKATIWEHHDLIVLADKLNCSAFLWECMGLTDAYVAILQHKWSQDDISTITNTYPDHEDLQGPAGYDIPKVMTCFIPKKGTLLTTEEQMYPILAEDCLKKETHFTRLGWLEAGLLTPDVLNRFPYEEHPFNIALVIVLAEALGVPPDVALKEIADRVVPDIGVLKAFPAAMVDGRTLEFINGMSANERFATLSNWQRMRFETDPATGPDPSIILSTVVNNRADRISRSSMFGSILALDLIADRYILIGSNLAGLSGYIQAAWKQYSVTLSLAPNIPQETKSALTLLEELAQRLRIPYQSAFIQKRLTAMLTPFLAADAVKTLVKMHWHDPKMLAQTLQGHATFKDKAMIKEIQQHLNEHLTFFQEYEDFKKQINESGNNSESLTLKFRQLADDWFIRRIVTVEDYHATGNQVINRIAQETPPGLMNRIMGMQNIKGTGLDFVYRWQAWEHCHQACSALLSDEEDIFEEGLKSLIAFQDYGLLCEAFVQATVQQASQGRHARLERTQAGLNLILNNMTQAITQVRNNLITTVKKETFWSKIPDWLEVFLDAGDAVKRRKKANRIYQDLADERISHARAAIELQALNKRQKGGWLRKALQSKQSSL